MLYMPIVVLFYQDNGLEMFDIFLLKGIYSVSIVIWEIPSGYLADVLGRKLTLIIGALLGFFGFLTYSFSLGFIGFLVAEIILGVGQSLVSGADSALLYDTLEDRGLKEKYAKYEGRVISIGNFAEAIAGILGGVIAGLSLRYPFYVQSAVAFTAIPAALTLYEPSRVKKLMKAKFSDILQIVHYSLIKNKLLRWNIVFSSIIGTATLTMAWFVQPFFKVIELPVSLFGVFWTILNIIVAIGAMYAYRIEYRFNQFKSMLIILIFISASYLSLSFMKGYLGIAILIIFYMIRGFATPVLKDYINRLTEANIRATVLSVRNFVIRVLFAAIGPLLGWYTDHYSLSSALIISGFIFLISSSLVFVSLNSVKKKYA